MSGINLQAPLGKAERSRDAGVDEVGDPPSRLPVSSWARLTPSFAAGDATVAVQRLGPPEVEARREALLRQMLARPSDLDLAFEYAQLSSQVGDYEGAVSTLERMLIYAPNTPRLQLELGILYYRLGAYDGARSYFEQALANPSVPPSVAAQVRLYLQQLAIAADPPSFSATIFSAIRWESNANAGPGTQSVTLNGIDFTLDSQSVGRAGWSALNIGTMHYSWDLKRQGDRIEFDALAYSTAYFDSKLQDIDLDFFEATVGPSFNMKRWGMDKTRAFIYAIGDLAYLGYDPYFTAPGAGLRLLSFATERSVLDAGLRRAGASSTTRPIFCSTRSATEHRQGLARPIPTT